MRFHFLGGSRDIYALGGGVNMKGSGGVEVAVGGKAYGVVSFTAGSTLNA